MGTLDNPMFEADVDAIMAGFLGSVFSTTDGFLVHSASEQNSEGSRAPPRQRPRSRLVTACPKGLRIGI